MTSAIDLNTQIKLRNKYTALWAFSESVFGGILHAFKIPFTGLFLGGFAVIFLSLISDITESKKEILKVTSVVILVKLMLSPNSPLQAYLAVFIQGLFAFIVFSVFKSRSLSILLLSFLSSIWSAFQKIIVTTIVFGMTFWYSIDSFTLYLAKSMGISLNNNFSMSVLLISGYILIHLAGAIIFARLAIKFPEYLSKNSINEIKINYKNFQLNTQNGNSFNKPKKKWYKKPSRVILVIFLLIVASVTYINPELGKVKFIDIVSMTIRALLVIYFWFQILSPLLVKLLLRIFKRKSELSKVEELTSLFPEFKSMILYCWKVNSNLPKLKRIKKFLEDSLLLLLQ